MVKYTEEVIDLYPEAITGHVAILPVPQILDVCKDYPPLARERS